MPKLITFFTPKAGEWRLIVKFEKEIRAVIYDPRERNDPDSVKNPASLIILGWPYGLGTFNLQWTEIVPDEETAKNAINSRGYSKGKKKYKSYRKFANSNIIIGTREETVDYLNRIETLHAVVEVTAIDGGSLEIVIVIAVEILDPLLTKDLQDFMGYAIIHITKAIRNLASKMKFDEILTIDSKPVMDVVDQLDSSIFEENGFTIPNVALLAIPVAERSLDLLESKEKISKEQNAAEAAKFIAEAEIALTKAQTARNNTEINYQKKLFKIKEDFLKNSAEARKTANSGWGGSNGLDRLYLGSANNMTEELIEAGDFTESDKNRRPPAKKGEPKTKGGNDGNN